MKKNPPNKLKQKRRKAGKKEVKTDAYNLQKITVFQAVKLVRGGEFCYH